MLKLPVLDIVVCCDATCRPVYPVQGGHGTGKTGNLVLTFSRQGKHREFCSDTEKFANTGKIFGL